MPPIKQRGAVGSSHSNDKAGEFARMKAGSAASMEELREFMSHMRGKSPQQIMGLVAESGLAQGIILSTIATAVLLVVFTVLPYMIYGPKEDKAAARQAAAAEKAAADKAAAEKESAQQAEKEKGAEKSGGTSKEKAMKSMTKDFDEVKGKSAGDEPAVENLLDKLE